MTYAGSTPPSSCSACGVRFAYIREADGRIKFNPGVPPGGMPGGFTPPALPPVVTPPTFPAPGMPVATPPVAMPAVATPPVMPAVPAPTTRTEGYRCDKCGKTFIGATPPASCSGCGVRFGYVREADGSTRTVNGGGLSGGAWAGIITGIFFLIGLIGFAVKQIVG